MPPNCKLEFVIEVVPDTTPIFKRPYRRVVNQLAKLKEQLQKLLDKRYIHPSASPWGALDKGNVVANALSRRSHLNILATRELLSEFYKEFEKLNLRWVSNTEIITMEVDSTLEQDIQKG
jgi:hypothetical protein